MKAASIALQVGILAGIMILILQGAGLVFQPPLPSEHAGPVEVTGTVRVSSLPDVHLGHSPIVHVETMPEIVIGERVDVNIEQFGDQYVTSFWRLPVDLEGVAGHPLGWNDIHDEIGIRRDNSSLLDSIHWGSFTVKRD